MLPNILKKKKLIFYQLPLELIGKTFILKKKSFKNTLNNVKNNCTRVDICHKFVNDVRRSINNKYFDFHSLTHYVSDCEFNIFISYNPSLFYFDALVFEICKKPKKVILPPMAGKLTDPWLKGEINLNLHLTTLKKRLLFLFQLFSEKNGLFLVFA